MAELSYRFLERPFLGWRERFSNHPEARPKADPAPKLKAASASA
jgi:peptidoglycan/LPS O-acetylase OafA/YrhL